MAKILLIDDDVILRRLLKNVLTEEGHEVIEAVNGKEGLLKLRSVSIELVLTDLIMPEKEGLETIQAIKKDWPGTRIIAMSGGGRISAMDYLVIARQLGADQVFAKPFYNEDLIKIVELAIRSSN